VKGVGLKWKKKKSKNKTWHGIEGSWVGGGKLGLAGMGNEGSKLKKKKTARNNSFWGGKQGTMGEMPSRK